MTKLTKENIETQILLYVDSELSVEEVRNLLAFLEQYPEYKALLSDYQDSVLSLEEMVFADKKQLLQTPNRKVVPLRIIGGIAAAVAIILTIAGYYQWTNNDGLSQNRGRMVLNRADSAANSQTQMVAEADNAGLKQDAVPVGKPSQRQGRAQNVLPVNALMVATTQKQQKNVRAIKPLTIIPMVAITSDQQPVTVVVEPFEPDLSVQQPIVAPQPEGLPESQIAAILEQSDRLKGVHSLVAELDERKNKAVDAWQQIKSANVILKIGSKEIVIN